MSLLWPTVSLAKQAYTVGRDHAADILSAKEAAAPVATPKLAGRLFCSQSGWLLLSVPNALVRGLFDALHEPGIELPTKDTDDPEAKLRAHISVMTADEVEGLGGADRITERGHSFHYQLGPIKSVSPPTWNGVSRVWFCQVQSPELKNLRKSYGLSALPNEDHEFHITVAIRKTGVLQPNELAKAGGEYSEHAWQNTPLRWQPGEGMLNNLLSHTRRVSDRTGRSIRENENMQSWQSSQDPRYRTWLMLQALQGQMPGRPDWQDRIWSSMGNALPGKVALDLSSKPGSPSQGPLSMTTTGNTQQPPVQLRSFDSATGLSPIRSRLNFLKPPAHPPIPQATMPTVTPTVAPQQAPAPTPPPGVIARAKIAAPMHTMLHDIKQRSDRKQYGQKHSRLHQLIKDKPGDWEIGEDKGLASVKHLPSGYRFHLPKRALPATQGPPNASTPN